MRASGPHSDYLEVRTSAHVPFELADGADPRRPDSNSNAWDGRVLRPIWLIGARRDRPAWPQRRSTAGEFCCPSKGLPCWVALFAIFAETDTDINVVVYIDMKGRSK